jgi:hypothetical protein
MVGTVFVSAQRSAAVALRFVLSLAPTTPEIQYSIMTPFDKVLYE